MVRLLPSQSGVRGCLRVTGSMTSLFDAVLFPQWETEFSETVRREICL